jgi:hypothetical protein
MITKIPSIKSHTIFASSHPSAHDHYSIIKKFAQALYAVFCYTILLFHELTLIFLLLMSGIYVKLCLLVADIQVFFNNVHHGALNSSALR